MKFWEITLKRVFFIILVSSLTLTGCGFSFNGGSSRNSINTDVILLDISGSSINSVGTYNSEDHSTSSLSSRQAQLRSKLERSISENTAVYFGFVKKTYGGQELVSLIPPKLLLNIQSYIEEDMNNEVRRKDTREAVAEIWRGLISSQESITPNCSEQVSSNLINKSLGKLTLSHSSSIAGDLCSGAKSVKDVILQLEGSPKDIGSDIQGAIDRSLEKIASEERRLFSPEGKPINLTARFILVSDLIQKMDAGFITKILAPLQNKEAACSFATESSVDHRLSYEGGPVLVSDGFAGTKGKINERERDKLKEYWVCWLKTRGIYEVDLGARGIDLGSL